MTLLHSASLSRSTSLLGVLGLGFTLLAAAPGCSSDDTSAEMTPAPDGGAGGGSAGSAGGGMAGSTTAGGGGTGGTSSTADAGLLCAHPQMASDVGDHCDTDAGTIRQAATTCPSGGDAAASGDGGAPFSHSGTFTDDDDCKYDVSYGIACDGATFTFNITLKSRTQMAAGDAGELGVTGANPQIEAVSQDMPSHKLPSTPKPVTTEVGNGDYKISNVPLDLEGFWTVRFTFFPACAGTEATSKHGGVSFTVIMR
jgi:hypothetical protein